VALLFNLFLFGIGLYFEVHPRDGEDVWSAGGVAAVAVLNSSALTMPYAGRGTTRRFVTRLRRIAALANVLLLLVAVVIVVFEVLNDWSHALVHGAALVLPPFFTLLALREQRRA
jgi:hypothetical protein